MAPKPLNYRLWLQTELAEHQRRNPAFSLRAFASRIGLSPATLSQVISGKRPLTVRAASRIADRLALAPDDRAALLRSVPRAQPDGAAPSSAQADAQVLEVETFRVIADWWHYAILGLARVSGHAADPAWIAARLGITPLQAEQAVERLVRLGLLAVRGGKLRQTTRRLETTSDVASAAIRKFHRQTLRKAEESLERDPLDQREFGAETVAIDPKNLAEAKAELRAFRARLGKLLQRGRPQRVYTLSLQLFPIDHPSLTETRRPPR